MPSQIADDLKLGNIPLINLMHEFFLWNKHIRSPKFKEQCAVGHVGLIHTPLMIWGGDVSDLLTLILQRTILGCESYVGGAVWIELGNAGRLTTELNKQVRNPFSIKLKQGGTADRYYNAVPALLDPKLALEKKNSALWAIVKEFYSEIRNKILHGYQIGSHNPGVLYRHFDMFFKIYEWIGEWHPPKVPNAAPFKMTFVFNPRPKKP